MSEPKRRLGRRRTKAAGEGPGPRWLTHMAGCPTCQQWFGGLRNRSVAAALPDLECGEGRARAEAVVKALR